MEPFIAALALVLSIISLVWQAYSSRRQRTDNLIIQTLSSMAQLERSLADVPAAFRFHGVSVDKMKEAGFDPAEIAYLVSNITLGGIFHRLHKEHNDIEFVPGSYRYELCRSEYVRDAWPFAERLLTDTDYKKRIVRTLRNIHGDTFSEKLKNV